MDGQHTARYVGVGGVAQWLEVEPGTVSKWLIRYAETHPCPSPDAEIVEGVKVTRGWLPEREAQWKEWAEARVGQGAAGRPKPRRP